MTPDPVPDLHLPNGRIVPGRTMERFFWAGREHGLTWAESLPDVLASWCERWGITLDTDMPDQGMNLVLFGTSTRYGPVAIKISPPHEEVTAEINALRIHMSPRVVQVIDADPSVSIMLQRRIMPGTTLRSEVEAGRLTERQATEIDVRLLREYWLTPPEEPRFFTLERWFRALFAYHDTYPSGGGRIPHEHMRMAVKVAEDVLGTQSDPVTLHGDLHHDNILLDEEDGWTIIDPKGLVGERGYDIAHWLLNPPGVDRRGDIAQLTSDRLDWYSELLGIDRFRLWQWAMPHSVLSDCWNLEGGENNVLFGRAIADALLTMPEARSYS